MTALVQSSDNIDTRKNDFMAALTAEADDEAVVNRYLLHGSCYAIGEAEHYALKQEIAAKFSLEVNQHVFVVGSAKLGFSIAPRKRYRDFGDRSDIDVAIVSHELYQRVWHEVHEYAESGADWPRRADFERYAAWGWIRPDKLPAGAAFQFTSEWWDFFRSIQRHQRYGPFKVAAGLYHDMRFLVRYQRRAVSACRNATVGNV